MVNAGFVELVAGVVPVAAAIAIFHGNVLGIWAPAGVGLVVIGLAALIASALAARFRASFPSD